MAEEQKTEILSNEERLWKYKNTRYINLTNLIGEDMARYCLCAAFNVAYDPDIDCVSFEDYCDQIKNKKFREGFIKSFVDDAVSEDQIKEWQQTWGIGDSSKPYTVEDYVALERIFKIYADRPLKTGGMDAQQEDTLRTCSRMRLESDKCIAKGGKDNIDMASKLSKMVQDLLTAEQLRKRDEKPTAALKIDGVVDYLQKKMGLDFSMSYEEVKAGTAQWLVTHKYPQTMDATEHALLAIMNTTRANEDLPPFSELPEEAKIPQSMAHEFADKPNQAEKEAYEYLKLQRHGKPKLM